MFVAVVVFGILIFWIIYKIIVKHDFFSYHEHAQSMVNHLVFCIALVVVTIPEGLKLAQTVAISSSLKKQFDRNSLIRSL